MTDIPKDIKIEKKVGGIKTNTILIGIIESSIFTVIMIILGSTILRKYQPIIDQYELFYLAFQFLFVPLLNLLCKNYKALGGNIIGIPIGLGSFMMIAVLFGYRG
jgi:hypothetical protein